MRELQHCSQNMQLPHALHCSRMVTMVMQLYSTHLVVVHSQMLHVFEIEWQDTA